MNIPVARKIYWWASLGGLALVWGGMFRKHQGHRSHGQYCACMMNCLPCGIDGVRGK